MSRFIRRSVAPLLAGMLVAGVFVGVGEDVLPFDGLLTQAEATPPPTTTDDPSATAPRLFDADSLTPVEELDLDDLIAEETEFDTDSVFVDLDDVGDYFGIYDYGEEVRVDVAEELELVVPQDRADEFDSEDVGVVSAREAAERFLLSHRCNALFALGIREQVSRPIVARVLREDRELVAQMENLLNGDELPAGVQPLSDVPRSRLFVDSEGQFSVPPLESTVEVGTVTVSVFDPDLIRARPPALIEDLLFGESELAELLPQEVTPESVVTPDVLEGLWTFCLLESTQEGTAPVPQTISGKPVFALTRDDPPDRNADPTASGTDVVTWIEEGLEIRVEADFDAVNDALNVNPFIEFESQQHLETFADPVEIAFEVASEIVSRRTDPTDVLAREAFAAPGDVEYGEPIAGTETQILDHLSAGTATFEGLLAQAEVEAGAADGEEADETLAGRVRRAISRPVFTPGAIEGNDRRLFATPVGSGLRELTLPLGVLQQVIWDPEFLNSDSFREGWRRGIARDSDVAVSLDQIADQLADDVVADPDSLFSDEDVDAPLVRAGVTTEDFANLPERQIREFVEEAVAEVFLAELGVVDFVIAEREGIPRTHWLTPCYSMSAAGGIDASAVIEAQHQARRDVFGDRLNLFDPVGGPALDNADVGPELRGAMFDAVRARLIAADLDLDAMAGPALDEAQLDYELAQEKFLEEFQAAQDEADREERAARDALRTAQCSRSNLQIFNTGFPVVDLDDNGIDDHLPENDVSLTTGEDE